MSSSRVVYVIQCRGGRFYVGECNRNRVEQRFEEHATGHGSSFTSIFPPIRLREIRPLLTRNDEDSVVLEYMRGYGIDKVRGGTYSQIDLPEHQILTIEDQINHESGRCFRCGEQGHFAIDCPIISGRACFRCGRDSHWARDCFARTDVYGRVILDAISDEEEI